MASIAACDCAQVAVSERAGDTVNMTRSKSDCALRESARRSSSRACKQVRSTSPMVQNRIHPRLSQISFRRTKKYISSQLQSSLEAEGQRGFHLNSQYRRLLSRRE